MLSRFLEYHRHARGTNETQDEGEIDALLNSEWAQIGTKVEISLL